MALYQKSEVAKISATTTANFATFASGVSEVHIYTDGDIYVSFDETVPTATTGYFVKGSTEAHPFVFLHGGPNKVWAVASSTANVFILVIR